MLSGTSHGGRQKYNLYDFTAQEEQELAEAGKRAANSQWFMLDYDTDASFGYRVDKQDVLVAKGDVLSFEKSDVLCFRFQKNFTNIIPFEIPQTGRFKSRVKALSETIKEEMTRCLARHHIVLTPYEQRLMVKHFPKITFSTLACAAELVAFDEDISNLELL